MNNYNVKQKLDHFLYIYYVQVKKQLQKLNNQQLILVKLY